jgi:hypothetical protein
MLLSLVTLMIFNFDIIDHVRLFSGLINFLKHSAFKAFKLLYSIVDQGQVLF